MIYSNYGVFVWLNEDRREDKEDTTTFAADKEAEDSDWVGKIHHGVLGDGNIRVGFEEEKKWVK